MTDDRPSGARGLKPQARDAVLRTQLHAQVATARRWQALAESAVATVRRAGPDSLTGAGIRQRKTLMDRFRRENSVLREHVRTRADAELRSAQWSAIASVVLVGTLPIALDLDHFKQLNDRHGHQAGDELFRAADRALYGPKAAGRDRVQVAGADALATAGPD